MSAVRPIGVALALAVVLTAVPFVVKPYQLDIAIFLLINVLVVVTALVIRLGGGVLGLW